MGLVWGSKTTRGGLLGIARWVDGVESVGPARVSPAWGVLRAVMC